MKIKRVTVTRLFGMFNHIIPFNLDERITIIHGSNGLGKTIVLKMIYGLFSSVYSIFRSIPFDEFAVDFDDGARVAITKMQEKNKDSKQGDFELAIEYSLPGEMTRLSKLSTTMHLKEVDVPAYLLEDMLPGLSRIGPDLWWMAQTGEKFTAEQLIDTYEHHFSTQVSRPFQRSLFDNIYQNEPEWIKAIKDRINVRFIETQRLVTPSLPGRKRRHDPSTLLAVAKYSDELAEVIKNKLGKYASLSQDLDQTFPMRVLDLESQAAPSSELLMTKLGAIESKMNRLRAADLLDKELGPMLRPQQPITDDPTKRNVLSVFADDVEQKLSVFDEVMGKIELLKHFVKDHFLNKELSISKERGFVLTSIQTMEELSPTQLSSGEQHELVLFYELLFRIKPDSLILIDEPEISLHPDWQIQFLRDLEKIIKLSSFDVLIATHSPLIIGQRRDLAVELGVEG